MKMEFTMVIFSAFVDCCLFNMFYIAELFGIEDMLINEKTGKLISW